MKIVNASAKIARPPQFASLRDYGMELIRKVEWCARISHASEDKQTDHSWERFIKFVVMEKGDWSVTEHATITCIFVVDRGITHEIVRHRLFAYTQESTRFINYGKNGREPTFVEPPLETESERLAWKMHMIDCERYYHDALMTFKIAPQIARGGLPNSLAAKIVMTGNLRAWRHFLRMRTTKEAHPQMREVTIPLLHEFQNCVPLLYDDILPNQRQADAVKLPA